MSVELLNNHLIESGQVHRANEFLLRLQSVKAVQTSDLKVRETSKSYLCSSNSQTAMKLVFVSIHNHLLINIFKTNKKHLQFHATEFS
jgi:hypothetical protein